MRVAVIGAGWAGLAAAVEATRLGCQVVVFERAPVVGGRARRVHWRLGEQHIPIDNGQHVLIGAYSETLAFMERVGIEERSVLERFTLRIEYLDGPAIRAPRWPAPLHLAAALLGARSLRWRARLSALRFAGWARMRGWRLDADCTVEQLLRSHGSDRDAAELLWQPLCVAALNTPIEQASAQVFLNVLRDSLGAARQASDLLVPRTDLSAVLPDAASEWLSRRGAQVQVRRGVRRLERVPASGGDERPAWRLRGAGADLPLAADCPLSASDGPQPVSNGAPFDAVIVATSPHDAAALLATAVGRTVPNGNSGLDAAAHTIRLLEALRPSPIVTVWMLLPDGAHWDRPMWALRTDRPDSPAHWLFARDRQSDGRRLLAAVISAHAGLRDDAALAKAVLMQLRRELASWTARPAELVPDDAPMKIVTERRATFLCTPSLVRPGHQTGLPSVFLAGDYTDSPYPGTLETAIRSGLAAAQAAATIPR